MQFFTEPHQKPALLPTQPQWLDGCWTPLYRWQKGGYGRLHRLPFSSVGAPGRQLALLAPQPVLFSLFSWGFENTDSSLTRFAPYYGPFVYVSLYLWTWVNLHPFLPPPPVSERKKKKKSKPKYGTHVPFGWAVERGWENGNCHWPSVPMCRPALTPGSPWHCCWPQLEPANHSTSTFQGLPFLQLSSFEASLCVCRLTLPACEKSNLPEFRVDLEAGKASLTLRSGIFCHLSDWMAVGSHDSPWGHTFPGKVYSNREAEVFAGAFQTARPRSNSLHAALASFEVELHGVNRKTTTFLLSLASFAELAFIFSQ